MFIFPTKHTFGRNSSKASNLEEFDLQSLNVLAKSGYITEIIYSRTSLSGSPRYLELKSISRGFITNIFSDIFYNSIYMHVEALSQLAYLELPLSRTETPFCGFTNLFSGI